MLKKIKGKRVVLVRTRSAGVHYGIEQKRTGKEITLKKTRRVHYWEGACSLSQISLEGVKKPEKCRLTVQIPENTLTEPTEIMPITKKAYRNLKKVPIWKSN